MAAEPRTMPNPRIVVTPALGSDLSRHTGLRLGFLTRLEVGTDAADSYRFALEVFEAAEALGYDVGWIAQHHFLNGEGRLPSVFPFLAAAAQRTRRIGLGTGVVTLPLEDPIRVAEDAAFVDTLSGGRLELGLGTGGDPLTFSAFGLDVEARRERYAEGFLALHDALAGRPINGTDAVLYPAAPTLPERIWEATFSVEGGARIGQHGSGLLLARTAAHVRDPADVVQEPIAQAYLQALTSNTHDHAAVAPGLPLSRARERGAGGEGLPTGSGGEVLPRVGMSRTVYAAADLATAMAHLDGGISAWVKSLISRGAFPTGLSREEAYARIHVHYGHPEEVVESIRADKLTPLSTDLICQVQPGDPTPDQILKSLELVAREVAPALGWRPSQSP
ncbi:MAG TPA: LLM class flavin-dependent oxidoreductase [Chloroflexota bacterium]|nr:LLM class flavin-dependent oxidoreductase [Chloroflexota bacterium]